MSNVDHTGVGVGRSTLKHCKVSQPPSLPASQTDAVLPTHQQVQGDQARVKVQTSQIPTWQATVRQPQEEKMEA